MGERVWTKKMALIPDWIGFTASVSAIFAVGLLSRAALGPSSNVNSKRIGGSRAASSDVGVATVQAPMRNAYATRRVDFNCKGWRFYCWNVFAIAPAASSAVP